MKQNDDDADDYEEVDILGTDDFRLRQRRGTSHGYHQEFDREQFRYRTRTKLAESRVTIRNCNRNSFYIDNFDDELKPQVRDRTTSFSSYFMKKVSRVEEKPRMEDTEEFWMKFKRVNIIQSSFLGSKFQQLFRK